MFSTIFCGLVLFIICYIIGNYTLNLFNKKKEIQYNTFETYFIGLAIVSSFLIVWSLFLPTNYISILLLIAFSIYVLYLRVFNFKIHFKNILKVSKINFLYLLIFIAVLLSSIVLPKNYDTYLYHIQAIMWNENYSVVPGLANFYDRLGFNSSLYVISASFSFNFLYNQYFFVVCSVTFFMFFAWIIKTILSSTNLFLIIFLSLFLYLFIEQYKNFISSPDSDLISNLIFCYIVLSFIINKNQINERWYFYTILSMYCVTLKLSTLPVLIIGLYVIFNHYKSVLKSFKYIFLFGVFLILPWLTRNIITSGYLLYPNSEIDLFSFEWKVPIENIEITKKWIYSFGRIPFKYYEEVLSLPFIDWFTVWWKAALLKTKILFILISFSPLISFYFIFKSKKNNKIPLIIGFVVCFISFIIWLFTAPDIRFIFGIIILLALYPLLLIKNINFQINKLYTYVAILFLIIFYNIESYNLFSKQYKYEKVMSYIYLPKDLFYLKFEKNIQYQEFNLKTKNNTKYKFYSAIGDTQTYDKFPCTVNYLGKIELIGENIQDGFKKIED